MIEIWKDVIDYENSYEVSNLGNVRNKKTKRVLSQHTHKVSGYKTVHLCQNNVDKTWRVHRLVAMAFIPNSDNKSDVNHKNKIRRDNRLCNLEWNTKLENETHKRRVIDWKPLIQHVSSLIPL